MNDQIQIHIDPAAIPDEDVLGQFITAGIRLIAKKCGVEGNWAEKYGAEVENEVFSMHPCCWCEEDGCKYCQEINPAPNFLHKKSGLSVHWYKYIGRSMEIKGNIDEVGALDIIKECLESISEKKK